MRRFIGSAVLILAAAVPLALTGAAGAAPVGDHASSSTTLDACGYFVGTQTIRSDETRVASDGTVYDIQHGTWTGVENNYYLTPVASLGTVQGAYTQVTYTASDGTIVRTETFTSDAGMIAQSFMIGPNVPGYFSVDVTATRDLAFLTSSTAGQCYSGPAPRP